MIQRLIYLFIFSLIILPVVPDAYASLEELGFTDMGSCSACPPDQSCWVRGSGLTATTTCGQPAPELSIMMLPVAIGTAGLLAVRARRRSAAKSNKTSSH